MLVSGFDMRGIGRLPRHGSFVFYVRLRGVALEWLARVARCSIERSRPAMHCRVHREARMSFQQTRTQQSGIVSTQRWWWVVARVAGRASQTHDSGRHDHALPPSTPMLWPPATLTAKIPSLDLRSPTMHDDIVDCSV